MRVDVEDWDSWHRSKSAIASIMRDVHAKRLANYGMRPAPPLDYDGLERFIAWLDSELLNVMRRKKGGLAR